MAPPRSKTSRKATAVDPETIAKEKRDEAGPENPPTVDPLRPHSLLFHAIDLTSYEILKDPLNRAERAATMEVSEEPTMLVGDMVGGAENIGFGLDVRHIT